MSTFYLLRISKAAVAFLQILRQSVDLKTMWAVDFAAQADGQVRVVPDLGTDKGRAVIGKTPHKPNWTPKIFDGYLLSRAGFFMDTPTLSATPKYYFSDFIIRDANPEAAPNSSPAISYYLSAGNIQTSTYVRLVNGASNLTISTGVVNAGAETETGTVNKAVLALDTRHRVFVELSGDTYKVYVNGVLVLTATDVQHSANAGNVATVNYPVPVLGGRTADFQLGSFFVLHNY